MAVAAARQYTTFVFSQGGGCGGNVEEKGSVIHAGYLMVLRNDESALLQLVVTQSVSTAVDVSSFGFRYYGGGVFFAEDCGTNLGHVVAVVGYGLREEGTKVWVLKNTCGEEWGEGGYMRMRRDVSQNEELSGITMDVCYPTLDVGPAFWASNQGPCLFAPKADPASQVG
ncbi:Cysteine proteinases superfamily protein [Striga hermonthica]|uniref:Cysteine proteinases superfamily protein n=1 Tax=Striga hermonthica TaxID=68872 RepID=A0A9N7MSA6_STRHE|nr:Cysteine proteinases superfamily protein [Striga hermonthica]